MRVVPGAEVPDRIPSHVLCLIHSERTPSLYLRSNGWYCFGCARGGDVVDLVQGIEGVSLERALTIVEAALGFAALSHGTLELLVSKARRPTPRDAPVTYSEWEREVEGLAKLFLLRARPYLRCRDPLVYDTAWSRADYVFHELDEAARVVPRTTRGARERLRELRAWSGSWAQIIERDIDRLTGKDRLGVATQA